MPRHEEYEALNTLGAHDTLGHDPEKYRADTEFWTLVRQAILGVLDAIERRWGFSPTTAEIRKIERERSRHGGDATK